MKEVRTSMYRVEIPDSWETRQTKEGFMQIYNPDGAGAVTISSYCSEGKAPDVVRELQQFARKEVPIQTTRVGVQDTAMAEYTHDEENIPRFSLVMVVGQPGGLLVVSYHCNQGDKRQEELDVVRKIIGTIMLMKTKS